MYREIHGSQLIQRIRDGAFIPQDEGNRDYQEYLRWRARGNTPESAVVPTQPDPFASPAISSLVEVMAELLGSTPSDVLTLARSRLASKR